MAGPKIDQPEWAHKARTLTMFHLSVSESGCEADVGSPDPIRPILSGALGSASDRSWTGEISLNSAPS